MGLCNRNCENCRYYETCGGCSLCEKPLCHKNCGSCFALCFERPGAALLLGDPKVDMRPNQDAALTYHIPIIPDLLKEKIDLELMPMAAVHAGNMLSRKGGHIYKKYLEQGFCGALNLDERTEGILEFYVRDKTLEGFWDNKKEILKGIAGMNFKAVIAPNFSVFEDAPRLDHLYNIKRSKFAYNELLDNGINAIPDISWFSIKDLEAWCSDIQKSNIKVIAFSFQVVDVGLKTANLWRFSLMGFRYLCQNISPDVKIMLLLRHSRRPDFMIA